MKTNYNRIKHLLFSGALVITLFTSCGNNSTTVYDVTTVAPDYNQLLEDCVDAMNEDLPIAFGDYMACLEFELYNDEFAIVYAVNEDYISMSEAMRNVKQNRELMLSVLSINTDRLTQQDRDDIDEEYGITGDFSSTSELLLYSLYKTGRSVTINLVGSNERQEYEVIRFTPQELRQAYDN